MHKSMAGCKRLTLFLIAVSFLALALFNGPGHTLHDARSSAQTLEPAAYLPIMRSPPPAIIRITEICRPGWLPKNGEFVKIENQGGSPGNLTNWKLKNINRGQTYTFPTFTLQPGRWVKVYSRVGINDDDELFWAHPDPWPIWGAGESACIFRSDGAQVDCMTAGTTSDC